MKCFDSALLGRLLALVGLSTTGSFALAAAPTKSLDVKSAPQRLQQPLSPEEVPQARDLRPPVDQELDLHLNEPSLPPELEQAVSLIAKQLVRQQFNSSLLQQDVDLDRWMRQFMELPGSTQLIDHEHANTNDLTKTGPQDSLLNSSSSLWMDLSSPVLGLALEVFRDWKLAKAQAQAEGAPAQHQVPQEQIKSPNSPLAYQDAGSQQQQVEEVEGLEVVAVVLGPDNSTEAEIVITIPDKGSLDGDDLVIDEEIFVMSPSDPKSNNAANSDTATDENGTREIIVIEELKPVVIETTEPSVPLAPPPVQASVDDVHTSILGRREEAQQQLDPLLVSNFQKQNDQKQDKSKNRNLLRRSKLKKGVERLDNQSKNTWPQHDRGYYHDQSRLNSSEVFGMRIVSLLSLLGVLMVLFVWKKSRRVLRRMDPVQQQQQHTTSQDSTRSRREEVLTGSRVFQFLGSDQDGYRAL